MHLRHSAEHSWVPSGKSLEGKEKVAMGSVMGCLSLQRLSIAHLL